MHPLGAQVLKYVHPAAKMCTQGAGLRQDPTVIVVVLLDILFMSVESREK